MDLVTPNPYQNNLETISNKTVKFILKILFQEYGTDCLGLVVFRYHCMFACWSLIALMSADRQTDRKIDRLIDRHTGRETY